MTFAGVAPDLDGLGIVADFFTHNNDAHMQLWPLTRWKFISPVSYYDPDHYGAIMQLVEFGLIILMLALLWRRFDARWVRWSSAVAMLAAIAVPIYFTFVMGGMR